MKKFRDIGVKVYIIKRKPCLSGNIVIRKMLNWYRLVYKQKKEFLRIINSHDINLIVINNSIINSNNILEVSSKLKLPVIAYERGYENYSRSHIRLSNKISSSVAVSHAIKNNMESQKYRASTRVIYDGLALKPVTCQQRERVGEIKREIGIPDDGIVIGIVGNLREWKGQEYFVRAFMSLGRKFENMYGLVVGGFGDESAEYVNFIKGIAEGSDVGKRLRFLGFRDDVQNLLGIMDVFVHASIRPEPFGMVILEAMYHKVPVVATNFGGPVETLENGRCGILVPPRDADAIIEGVEKYLKDPVFRDKIVERAYRRVTETFDLRRTVGLVEELFRETVPGANRF
ncbi:MAG TPA: glycosyltransferase family 4 protein [Geobacteraceae bacterium]|nr:glycosyltransferase family 4 protein [Geobacteraceae bacterium]